METGRNHLRWLFAMTASTVATLSTSCGVTPQPVNPSFPVDVDTATKAFDAMQRHPVCLERPVVVLGGFNDPGLGASWIEDRIHAATGDARTLSISFMFCNSFDECRDRAIRAVDRAFPSTDPNATTEVDVIGLSLGGIVARHAAAPPANPESSVPVRRLRIKRLFTISSPHRGATIASFPALTSLHADLRPDSEFLAALVAREAAARYELQPYCRLNDGVVGEQNTAPPGLNPRWVPNLPFQPSHTFCGSDPRILADIAKRLRGDAPLSSDPAAPLPAGVSG